MGVWALGCVMKKNVKKKVVGKIYFFSWLYMRNELNVIM